MASSPTAIGRVELQETGSNLNVWGDENNEVIKRLTEMGVGFKNISLTGDYTPTTTNYDANESRWGCIEFTDGGLSSQPTVTLPAETRYWLIINSGSTYAVACKASGSAVAAVTVEASSWAWIYCDGTDMFVRDLSNMSGVLRLNELTAPDGDVDLSSQKITSLADPTSAQDAATKNYIDTIASSGNLATVAGIASEITTVAAVDTEITTVSGISANVTTVAGISGNVTTVAGISANVTTVAGISANVTTVAGDSTDIQALAAITADISAAAAIDSDISTVAADATDIGTVSTNIASVNTCATNIADIQNASSLIDGLTAADIANVAAGNIAATDVQAALNELDTEKLALSGGTMTGALDMGANQISGSNVSFTGGSISGIADLAVADGGTGASTFTDGGVLVGNGTGAVQVTTAGTSGQVLTSNGAGVDPTFQDLAASGGLVLLSSATASSDATIEFTTGLDATYDVYELHFVNVRPASDEYLFQLRTSSDGGSTFDSGSGNYRYRCVRSTTSAVSVDDSASATSISITGAGTVDNSATEVGICGVLRIFRPGSSAEYTSFQWDITAYGSSSGHYGVSGTGARISVADVDALQFYFAVGNVSEGGFYLYGKKKS
jgi:hypothetical protein